MSKSRRRLFSLVLALLATVVVGYFVLRQLKWSDLTTLLANSDWRGLLLGFLTYSGANVLRALRFRALNQNLIPTGLLLRTVLVQNLLNTFLPLRAGEASYLYMVHRTGAVKPGENVGSLLGARVLDLLAALSLPALVLPLSRAASSGSIPLAWLALMPVVGVLGLALAIWRATWFADSCRARAERAQGLGARALSFLADLLTSLGRLKSGHLLGRVVGLTLACWVLIYACGYFTMRGVGLDLPVFDSVFAYSFPVVVSMMPFYMLGGFGVFEGSIGVGLNLVGVAMGPAMAAGLALHVAELLFILLPGPLTLVPRLWSRARADA